MTSFRPSQHELSILLRGLESFKFEDLGDDRDQEAAARLIRVLSVWAETQETADEERKRTASYAKVQDRGRRQAVEVPEGGRGVHAAEAVPVVPRTSQPTLGLE